MSRTCLAILPAFLVGCRAAPSDSSYLWTFTGNAEALAGAQAAPAVEARYGGSMCDLRTEERMRRVGDRLVQGTANLEGTYQYRLLNSARLDAVSLPGGRIYITQALFAELRTDDLVAAVLAHEMAHMADKDHFKPRPANAKEALLREQSADHRAAQYLDAGGYPPSALASIIQIVSEGQPAGWGEARLAALH